jgi:hypothetical protein
MTISSVDDGRICAVGSDTDERCVSAEALSLPDGIVAQVDDCVTVEVIGDSAEDVRAVWRGRCSTEPIALGVTRRAAGPTVLIPHCLGSFTSLRVEDADGTIHWSVARESSTEHPLLEYVTLGQVPPGFGERDPWNAPPADAELTVTVRQQVDLPPGRARFVTQALDDTIRVDTTVLDDPGELDAAAGCRASG